MAGALGKLAARAEESVFGLVKRATDLFGAVKRAAAALWRGSRGPKFTAKDVRLAFLLARPRPASAGEDPSLNRRWARVLRWAFAVFARSFLVVTIYFILLIPALLHNPEPRPSPYPRSGVPRASSHLPVEFENAEQVTAFFAAMDSTINQGLALALPVFLLIYWVYKNVALVEERHSLIGDLSLLLALGLTLTSVTAGMEAKWRLTVYVPIMLGVVTTTQPVPADYLLDKMLAQLVTLCRALALTLACLPALLVKVPPSR